MLCNRYQNRQPLVPLFRSTCKVLQRTFVALWFISFFLFVYSGPASADGKLVTKVNVVTGMSSESNYFRTQENERAVSSYFVNPGIEFGYTTPKSNILFNYVLNANWYDENGNPPAGQLSSDQLDYVGHDMKFTGDTQASDRVKIKISDTYILTRDPDRLDYYFNEIVRHKYAKNILRPELLYTFGAKFDCRTGYQYTDIDYLNDVVDDDSTESKGLFDLHYNMNSRNSLNLQYLYWKKDYERATPDYTSHQAMLTVNRESKYYKLSLSGGYHKRSFENNIQDTMEGFVWAIALSADRPEMLFSLSQNINDTSLNNDYYLATRFNGSIGHIFLEKFKVNLKGYYQYSDYLHNPDDRKDNSGKISCRLSYLKSEILSFGIEGGVEARNSSLSGNDYENVYVLIGLQLTHDFGSK